MTLMYIKLSIVDILRHKQIATDAMQTSYITYIVYISKTKFFSQFQFYIIFDSANPRKFRLYSDVTKENLDKPPGGFVEHGKRSPKVLSVKNDILKMFNELPYFVYISNRAQLSLFVDKMSTDLYPYRIGRIFYHHNLICLSDICLYQFR